jgi:hypothetical protein
MKQTSNSIPNGESKSGTIGNRPGLQSSNAGNPSTSATSATTADRKSPKDSQRTPNLADVTNASRLLQALSSKLGALVEWKRLELGDGREVIALVFPLDKWTIDPTGELVPVRNVGKSEVEK